jgi:hypothetical protein
MALARVVSFEDVPEERLAEMQGGDRPEGVPASEIIVLHDGEAGKALAILFFENEEDYREGDRALNAMAASDTPGRRTAVAKYTVAVRRTD